MNRFKTPEYIAWISMKTRCYNENRKTYHRSITEWSKELNISKSTLRKRIKMGWTIEKILNPKISLAHSNNNKAKWKN